MAHAWNTKHPVDWNSAKVRTSEQHLRKRRVLEAILIKQTPNNSNLDSVWPKSEPDLVPTPWLISHPIIHHMLTAHLSLPTHLLPPFLLLRHNTHTPCFLHTQFSIQFSIFLTLYYTHKPNQLFWLFIELCFLFSPQLKKTYGLKRPGVLHCSFCYGKVHKRSATLPPYLYTLGSKHLL